MTGASTTPATRPSADDQSTTHRPRIMTWLSAGFAVWLVATLVLAWIGDLFLERGPVVYVAFVIAICAGFIGLFALLGHLVGLARSALLSAAVAFSIAGMAGEVIVMATFPALVPALSAGSAGPFAAFLFLGYTALLGYALARSR